MKRKLLEKIEKGISKHKDLIKDSDIESISVLFNGRDRGESDVLSIILKYKNILEPRRMGKVCINDNIDMENKKDFNGILNIFINQINKEIGEKKNATKPASRSK